MRDVGKNWFEIILSAELLQLFEEHAVLIVIRESALCIHVLDLLDIKSAYIFS